MELKVSLASAIHSHVLYSARGRTGMSGAPAVHSLNVRLELRQCVGEPGCHCTGRTMESQQCRGQQPCSTNPPL
ncbi:hypothetical protein DICVIV_13811 [Dictyocaulus viviparus]|uniref:Uncharacterized protein n=1 Tax=Dictyocaulus viviparus TaxID=29172 RepID=A0A0D8X9E9_DICVI|nr:hypothetical protein DICVIV_13811 [Dictyocaulus viviparus]